MHCKCFHFQCITYVHSLKTIYIGVQKIIHFLSHLQVETSYLGWDGVFVLRLIEHNHGSNLATVILGKLWEFYANQMKAQEDGGAVDLEMGRPGEMGSVTSVAPSTSWHSCHAGACHLGHFTQQQKQRSSAPPHNGYWSKCS